MNSFTAFISFLGLFHSFSSELRWACAAPVPSPQWGVPAAADAANAIDFQRFQQISGVEQQPPVNDHHDGSFGFAQGQEIQRIPSASLPTTLSTAVARDMPSAPMGMPTRRKGMRRSRKKKRINRKNNGRYDNRQPQYSRRDILRQQQFYYPPQRPLQNWGFWKWGQDNISSFFRSLF